MATSFLHGERIALLIDKIIPTIGQKGVGRRWAAGLE